MSLIKVSLLALAALTPLLTHADVAPFWTPDPNGPKMTGPCQGNVTNAEFLGNVTSINTYSSRDVGYHGSIGNFQINIYGDTSQCPEGSQKDDCVSDLEPFICHSSQPRLRKAKTMFDVALFVDKELFDNGNGFSTNAEPIVEWCRFRWIQHCCVRHW